MRFNSVLYGVVCLSCSYAVPKRDTREFTRDVALKNDDKTLKSVFEKALLYFDGKVLPSNWQKDDLFGSESDEDDADEEVRNLNQYFRVCDVTVLCYCCCSRLMRSRAMRRTCLWRSSTSSWTNEARPSIARR